jgi:uncharacterized protein YndB with AHSA1/START domain
MSNPTSVVPTASVVHTSFTLERTYAAPPSRVFAAFADPAIKRRWYAEGERGWEIQEFTSDFRTGGREVLHGRLKDGAEIRNDGVYQDIVPERRIVMAATLSYRGQRVAVTLGTIVLLAAGHGTTLTYTDQNALLDGAEAFLGEGQPGSFKEGWRTLLERLDEYLRANT